MIAYRLGKLIMLGRRRLGESQEEFAGRLCAPLTLSRIENGHQAPCKELLSKIMSRIGVGPDPVSSVTDGDVGIGRLKALFEWNLVRRRYTRAEGVLKSLEEEREDPGSLENYLRLARSVVEHKQGKTRHELYMEEIARYFDTMICALVSVERMSQGTVKRAAGSCDLLPDTAILSCLSFKYTQLYLLTELARELKETQRPAQALGFLGAVDEMIGLDYIQGKMAHYVAAEAKLLRAAILFEMRDFKGAERICDKLLSSCDFLYVMPDILLLEARCRQMMQRDTDSVAQLLERAYYMALDQWEEERAESFRQELERV